jgi:hypothetical protein
LGDNANAIKIQIWCALIADLILKVIRKGSKSKMAFSNLTGLVRLHLMTYLDLNAFLKWPEKSLLNKIKYNNKNKSYNRRIYLKPRAWITQSDLFDSSNTVYTDILY